MVGPSPIQQLLQNVQPAIRPLAQMDVQNYAKGGQKLSNLEFNTARQSILTHKPVIVKNENQGILHDIMSLPGNIAKDATSTAMGFFSPWKWVPSIWHNVESGNVNGLLPLIPGYSTAKNIVTGNFHDILTHPVGTALDVLPYAHFALPRIGYGLADTESDALRAGQTANGVAGAETRNLPTAPAEPTLPTPTQPTIPETPPHTGSVLHEVLGIRPTTEEVQGAYGLRPDLTPRQTRVAAAMAEGKPGRTLFNLLPEGISSPDQGFLGRRLEDIKTRSAMSRVMGQANRGFINTIDKQYIQPLQDIFQNFNLPERKSFAEWWEHYNENTPDRWVDAAGQEHLVPQKLQEALPKFQDVYKKLEQSAQPNLHEFYYNNRKYLYHEDSPVVKAQADLIKQEGKVQSSLDAADTARDAWVQHQMEPVTENPAEIQIKDQGRPEQTMPTGEAMEAGTVAPHLLERPKIEDRAYIDDLKHDIAQNGMHEPIKIRNVNGQNVVWDGLHRLIAADELGMKRIPYRMVDEANRVLPDQEAIARTVEAIPRKSSRLFRTKDLITKTETELDNAAFRRSQIDNRADPRWARENERVNRLQTRLTKLQAQHDLLSRREMLVNRLNRLGPAASNLTPEDYDLLRIKAPGEVAPAKTYLKALEKLDKNKQALADARANFDKSFARHAPATFYPQIHDTVIQRLIDKYKANHPEFPEGMTTFDPNLTYHALDQQSLGRDPVRAGLATEKEVRSMTKEVESTWQQMADNGLNPQYLANVPEERYGSVLDPNIFRPGAAKDVPFAVRGRTHDLTPSGISDPVIGLTAPAMALLRRDSLRDFYNTYLAPSLKSESDLDSWLDREISNSQFEPTKAGESVFGRREAIKKSRWASFDTENIDPELAQFFPKGEKVYAPKEVYDSITQLFSPKGQNRLESLSQANIHGMRVFRTAVMGMSVKHLAHILFGGMSMLLMRGKLDEISPDMMRAAWHMVKDDVMPKELNAGVDFYSGRQVAAGITPEAERTGMAAKIGAKAAGALAGIQTFEERIANFERSLSYLSELKRLEAGGASPHLTSLENAEVKAAVARGDMDHARELAQRGAIRHANKALIDFDGMLPAERGIVRNIFPFYAFTRHIFKYAFTYPIDYPLRAAFVYRLGEIVQKQMQDEGLPEQWMRYLTFGPDPEGNVTNVDLRFLNPFRSLPDDASGSGLVNTLNPFLGYALEWAGVNPWTTSAERYPDIRYNPETGYVETKRKPFSLLGLVSQIVPEAGFLEHVAGGVDSRQPVHNLIPHYAFLPGWPYKSNINLQRAQDTLGQLEEAQSVVSKALKSGDTSDLKSYNLVPVPGYDKLIPGKLLAKVIDSLPNNGQTPRRQLGIR